MSIDERGTYLYLYSICLNKVLNLSTERSYKTFGKFILRYLFS